ncbi:MAG: anti-sigma F factor [Bacteroides sp.]|nr:anti-sigma F factor [Bacillota bacterium]MCM1455866.1 anti-sigma F factor [Bacteroides sp.]
MNNYFDMKMLANGKNEAFARSAVATFALACSPTLEEINDLKTAVSEAVTNAIVHAYPDENGIIELLAEVDENERSISVSITDFGCGIADVEAAKEPFFTTRADDERSGMGFTIIETFTDEMTVRSKVGEGTTVTMKKVFKNA